MVPIIEQVEKTARQGRRKPYDKMWENVLGYVHLVSFPSLAQDNKEHRVNSTVRSKTLMRLRGVIISSSPQSSRRYARPP